MSCWASREWLADACAEQLQKMGILPSPKTNEKPAATAKRKSIPMDFSQLKPLNPSGALGFSKFRDNEASSLRNGKNKLAGKDMDDMDSDEDEGFSDRPIKEEESEPSELTKAALSPDDIRKQGELAEGVQKIKVSTAEARILLENLDLLTIYS